jgi:uncharacterized protein (UPF0262 family)
VSGDAAAVAAMPAEAATAVSPSRIVSLEIDQRSIVRWTAEVEHERNVAIFDLLEANSFGLVDFRGLTGSSSRCARAT